MEERGKIKDAFRNKKDEAYLRTSAEKEAGCSIFFDVNRGFPGGFRRISYAALAFSSYAAGYNRKK